MRVIAHDPYLTEEQAAEPGARLVGPGPSSCTVRRHHRPHPLTAQTRGLIGRAQLEAMKPGAFVLNVARGGIVDEPALADALRAGQLAGAAVDVYSAEPMAPDNPAARRAELRPHARTSAPRPPRPRTGSAVEMAEQVLMALAGVTPPYAVNAPSVAPETAPQLRPYVELGRRLAILARQLAPAAFDALSLTYAGEIAEWECAPIRTAALAGILEAVTDQRVNAVNADLVAHERGLTVRETRTTSSEPWASLVELRSVRPTGGEAILAPGRLDRPWPPAPRRARRLRDRRRARRDDARHPPPRPARHRRRGRHDPGRGRDQHLVARAVAPVSRTARR